MSAKSQHRLVPESVASWIYTIQSSYWLVPTLMTLGAIGLAVVSIYLSLAYEDSLERLADEVFVIRPAGARAILATIAGSMITVAGVTFSVTTLAVAHATSSFGSRLFASFLRDRGSQVTLGTFVGTFVFCVLVLGIVSDGENGEVFVPILALLVAVLLALAGVAVLIFFVQHAQQNLYISEIISRLGRELESRVGDVFPSQTDEPTAHVDQSSLDPPHGVVEAPKSGYLQRVDTEVLFELACEHDCVLELNCSPGQYVMAGAPLVTVRSEQPADERLLESAQACLTLGPERTPSQDLMFVVDQLSQVAVRALSPGVNDPFTANTCMDWLVNFLSKLADRREPDNYRADQDGQLRVIATATRFADAADHALDQVRPYACTNLVASCHAIPLLRRLEELARGTALGAVVSTQIERWLATIDNHAWSRDDRMKLSGLIEEFQLADG